MPISQCSENGGGNKSLVAMVPPQVGKVSPSSLFKAGASSTHDWYIVSGASSELLTFTIVRLGLLLTRRKM